MEHLHDGADGCSLRPLLSECGWFSIHQDQFDEIEDVCRKTDGFWTFEELLDIALSDFMFQLPIYDDIYRVWKKEMQREKREQALKPKIDAYLARLEKRGLEER